MMNSSRAPSSAAHSGADRKCLISEHRCGVQPKAGSTGDTLDWGGEKQPRLQEKAQLAQTRPLILLAQMEPWPGLGTKGCPGERWGQRVKGASRLSASHPSVTWGRSGLVSDWRLNNLKGKRLAGVAVVAMQGPK